MKGTVYAIKNRVTGQFYIGKTYKTIEERFAIHIKDSKKERNKNRKLYKAMLEYGVENFVIFAIGEYEEGELELKEIEYIHYYDSFYNGYNSTLGGDGRRYLTVSNEEILECYQSIGTVKGVAHSLNISVDTVRSVLRSFELDLKAPLQTPVMIVETGEIFSSVANCARYLIDSGISKNGKQSSVSGCIFRVLRGERQKYLNYTFSLIGERRFSYTLD